MYDSPQHSYNDTLNIQEFLEKHTVVMSPFETSINTCAFLDVVTLIILKHTEAFKLYLWPNFIVEHLG